MQLLSFLVHLHFRSGSAAVRQLNPIHIFLVNFQEKVTAQGTTFDDSFYIDPLIRKDYVILHTTIMEGFERKQTARKLKASCEKNSDDFLKIF